ncbi:MAG: UvrD-helicase domain-containing protein, partial [Bacteroidia bacterium]|nr:UvrD-helicase domain-containing protein [Bacteroidia bacterium]
MNASFQIYNASAGSGKTFTLVKEYLKVLFNSPFKDAYKNALAITFTNKAVAEMKVRIIESLKEFSKASILEEPSQIFKDICNELDKKPQDIHIKAGKLLDSIINNYAAFDISTIDKFTQKLIRTFAYDLKLPLNFEVELDTDYLLQKAVNNLIAKAGSEKRLTKILVDFAIEKADDNKSWDVSLDLIKIAKLLINENDIYALNSLRDKTLNDFDSFKKIVIERIGLAEKNIIKQSSTALSLVEEYGLEYSDFSGGSRAYLPNYFLKLEKLETNISYDSAWIKNLEEKPLYPEKSTSDDIKAIIDDIQPELVSIFNNTRTEVFSLLLLKGIYRNLTPLSVLKHINSELEAIKEEQNIILISEFNTIISDHIKKQPAPFIYERIGERFRHYFIDEFQDTSQMQWENLIPLLENSLASENGSALIVGDAKQAIYRWRGGKAEQFINLFSDLNPFYVNKHVEDLPKNFRSSKQVVAFNNAFFKHLSTFAFRDETYSFLYKNAHQEIHQDNQGFVSLEFIEIQNEDDKREIYAQQTLKTIQNCLENGYNLQDLCVLVRYGKDGVTISEYLSKNGIDIISSETLLIKNAPEIKFIIQLLECISEPDNKLSKIKALNYLIETKLNIVNKHSIIECFKDTVIDVFFKDLEELNFYFNLNEFSALPFYEAIELIIYSFKLAPKSN